MVVEVFLFIRVRKEVVSSTSLIFSLVLLLFPLERQFSLPLLRGNGQHIAGQRGAVSAAEEVWRRRQVTCVVAVDGRRRIFERRRAPQLLVVLLLGGLYFKQILDFERAGLAHGVGVRRLVELTGVHASRGCLSLKGSDAPG